MANTCNMKGGLFVDIKIEILNQTYISVSIIVAFQLKSSITRLLFFI